MSSGGFGDPMASAGAGGRRGGRPAVVGAVLPAVGRTLPEAAPRPSAAGGRRGRRGAERVRQLLPAGGRRALSATSGPHDLWRLLVVIAARKAINLVQHDRRQALVAAAVWSGKVRCPARNGLGPRPAGGDRRPGADAGVRGAGAEEYERLLSKLDDKILRKLAIWEAGGLPQRGDRQQFDCSLRTVERKLAFGFASGCRSEGGGS